MAKRKHSQNIEPLRTCNVNYRTGYYKGYDNGFAYFKRYGNSEQKKGWSHGWLDGIAAAQDEQKRLAIYQERGKE